MEFIARQVISALLLPLPIATLLLFTGLVIAWWYKKIGLIIATAGFAILLLFSLSPIANPLTASLEQDHKPLLRIPKQVRYIVVLGGGVRTNPHIAPANTQLASASLSRLIEGIRLYHQLAYLGQRSKLVLSGGSIFNSPRTSGIMRNTAVMLGVPSSDLVLERGSKNTYQEARHLKSLLKNKPFVLVTSATHMRRSIAIFKANGMKPIPSPTQFLSKLKGYHSPKLYIPSSTNLVRSDLSLHEYLGILWASSKNQID